MKINKKILWIMWLS